MRNYARRIGDIRAAERAKENRRRYRRYITRIVMAVVIVLVVVFGAIFLYRSDFLHVDKVEVTGVSHLSDQEMTQTAAIPADSTLLRLDATAIAGRLKENAWVQDVQVHRVLPHTVRIDITERTPGAVVKLSKKSRWVVSADGTWLSAATNEDWKKDRRIIDVDASIATPVSGRDCKDDGIKNALAIYASVSDDLLARIKSISAESAVKTQLNLKGGVTVAFGDSSDVELKEADIWALLKKYKDKVSYINVRVPSAPTYRSLSGE